MRVAVTTPRLSPRQEEILRLVARGHTDREIAEIIGISKNTVKAHLRMAYQALYACNRAHAVALYALAGLPVK